MSTKRQRDNELLMAFADALLDGQLGDVDMFIAEHRSRLGTLIAERLVVEGRNFHFHDAPHQLGLPSDLTRSILRLCPRTLWAAESDRPLSALGVDDRSYHAVRRLPEFDLMLHESMRISQGALMRELVTRLADESRFRKSALYDAIVRQAEQVVRRLDAREIEARRQHHAQHHVHHQ